GAVFSCSAPEKIPGSIVIAIQTDMSARKDIDAVGIVITRDRQVVYEGVQAIAPTVYFPSTLVAYSYDKPAPIMVRVYAFKEGKARILRKAITIVPADRKALLRMPIDWVNDGSAEGQIAVSDRLAQVIDANAQEKDFEPVGEPKLVSVCGANQTMIDGTCTDARIDPATLPDYKPEEVFGGGDGDAGGGVCFDTLSCFADSTPVNKTPWEVRDGACVAEPASDLANALAFRLPPGGDGFCSGQACFVPVDTDTTGAAIRLENGLLRTPERFCEKLSQGRALVRSASCAAKKKETPVCSEASNVGPKPDAGPIVIPSVGVGEFVAAEPTNRPLTTLTPFVWNRWIGYGNIDGVWLRVLTDASVPVATGFVKSEFRTLSISNDGYLVRVNANDVRALRLPASPVKDQGTQQYSVGQERIWYGAPLTRTIAGAAYQNQILTSVITEAGNQLTVVECSLVNQDGPGIPLCNASPIATLPGSAAWIAAVGTPAPSNDILISTNSQLSKCFAEAPVAQKCVQHVPTPAGGPVVVGGGAAFFLDKSGKIFRTALAPTPVETFDELASGQTFPSGRESLTADANFVYYLREVAGKQQIAAIDIRGKGPVFPSPRVIAEIDLSDAAPSPTKPRIDGLSSGEDGSLYFGYWDPASPNNQRAQLRRLPKPAL
nr:hypothetical protein [Polyangiaceae bacterium]